MGLFSKHKEEKKEILPPMPPAPGAINSENNNQADVNLNTPPLDPTGISPVLSSPPMPGGNSLDEIKNQVMGNNIMDKNNLIDSKVDNLTNSSTVAPNTNANLQNTDFNSDDESLFDLSSLDIPSATEFHDSSFTLNNHSQYDLEDVNHDEVANLNFVSNKNVSRKVPKDDTFFVTTSQFKTFLEIIDTVKSRVKDSSERHLRLLDIKSEEDIEYENLRKDFQFIEDKLYEVDNLIFDK